MRAVFLGTPSAAVPALAGLRQILEVEVVVTKPDAPRGRSGQPVAPPVKLAAAEWGLEVAQPQDDDHLLAAVEGRELDVGVVVAFGRLIRPEVLAAVRVGFVNIHFSLLPRWRGASPVERAILAGDEATGVSLIALDEGLDTGPVIGTVETPITHEETGGSLTARLSHLGADLLVGALPDYLSGQRQPAPQIEAGATHAPRLTPAEAQLDSRESAGLTLRKVRAFNPRPGAWLSVGGTRVKVWAASPSRESVAPGVIVPFAGRPVLGVGDGSVTLDVVQAAGKRAAEGAAWMRGRRNQDNSVDSAAS